LSSSADTARANAHDRDAAESVLVDDRDEDLAGDFESGGDDGGNDLDGDGDDGIGEVERDDDEDLFCGGDDHANGAMNLSRSSGLLMMMNDYDDGCDYDYDCD
jgi:hypothetical protein